MILIRMAALSPVNQAPTEATGEPEVARKINAEIVLLLGWGPAILSQIAHPLVAAGVAEHSSFRASPLDRLRRLHSTLDAMLVLTFGTAPEVQRAASGIRAIHDRVHGRLGDAGGLYPGGAAYSAHDPELLRWVHATMLDLLPRAYELYVGPLTPAEKDRYCLESSGVEPLLGIPRGFLPRDMAALREYFDTMLASGEIAVTLTARSLAHEILWPRGSLLARPLLRQAQLPTVGLLPPAIRRAYGFRWAPRHERALRNQARVLRLLVPRLPGILRHWPAARSAARVVPT